MKELKSYISEAYIQKREEYKGVEIIIPQRTIDDFNRFSGLQVEQAEEFLHLLIDELGNSWGPKNTPVKMEAELFYSGYAGWSLRDGNGYQVGFLMFDKNVYGLEDAHQGNGWYLKKQNRSHDITFNDLSKMEYAIRKVGAKFKPERVRM